MDVVRYAASKLPTPHGEFRLVVYRTGAALGPGGTAVGGAIDAAAERHGQVFDLAERREVGRHERQVGGRQVNDQHAAAFFSAAGRRAGGRPSSRAVSAVHVFRSGA